MLVKTQRAGPDHTLLGACGKSGLSRKQLDHIYQTMSPARGQGYTGKVTETCMKKHRTQISINRDLSSLLMGFYGTVLKNPVHIMTVRRQGGAPGPRPRKRQAVRQFSQGYGGEKARRELQGSRPLLSWGRRWGRQFPRPTCDAQWLATHSGVVLTLQSRTLSVRFQLTHWLSVFNETVFSKCGM